MSVGMVIETESNARTPFGYVFVSFSMTSFMIGLDLGIGDGSKGDSDRMAEVTSVLLQPTPFSPTESRKRIDSPEISE